MRILLRVIINMFGLWLAARFVPGIIIADDTFFTLLLLAVIFGLVNAFIRPIVALLSFPITLLTLGLFAFVINALMLMLTAWLTPWLTLEGSFFQSFMAAFFGSLIISIVSAIAGWLLPDAR
ncbi:MAG: phage holin family protein [Caldilineaceae bacterium]|jgi:putative membrane protein